MDEWGRTPSPLSWFAGKPLPVNGTRTAARAQAPRAHPGPGTGHRRRRASGFRAALREVFGNTREQRCWVHKTGNILNAMPKSVQPKAKGHLHDIRAGPGRDQGRSRGRFRFLRRDLRCEIREGGGQTGQGPPRAAGLSRNFPAGHWKHIRTSNPFESTFATVRHRTGKTRGCLSRKTGLAMAFRLMMSAQAKWRKLDGANRLPEIVQGIEFKDRSKQLQHAA